MPFPAANWVIDVRGRRNNKVLWARDMEVHIFPAEAMARIDPDNAPKFRYAMHWDPEDVLLDPDRPDGWPLAQNDIIIWSQFPNQELALSFIREDKTGLDDDDFRLLTAYFMPVTTGEGGT